MRASTRVFAAFRPSWSTISDHSLHIDLTSSSRALIFLWNVDSSSLPGEAGGVGFVPPLLPATVPLLLEDFFFPGEDSGDNGVEGPLKEASLPLITRMVALDKRSRSPTFTKRSQILGNSCLSISAQYEKITVTY